MADVTGPAPFLPVHVRGAGRFRPAREQQAGPAAVSAALLVQTFGQLAVQAGDVPYLAACLPDALAGTGPRRGWPHPPGRCPRWRGWPRSRAASSCRTKSASMRRKSCPPVPRSPACPDDGGPARRHRPGAADGLAHLFRPPDAGHGQSCPHRPPACPQDGGHGFQGRLRGGLASPVKRASVAWRSCSLPRFCLESKRLQEEVPQGGGAETGAVGLGGRWGRCDIERCGGSCSQVGGRASTWRL